MALVGRDHLEGKVLAVWRDLLGTAPSSLDADFFSEGGTSLQAALLVARLSDGAEQVGLEEFMRDPRPRSLTDLLRDRRPKRNGGVVVLRAAGAGVPLVLVPVGAGMGFLASTVLDRPVFALDPLTAPNGPAPIDLPSQVAGLTDRVEQKVPHGDLQLIGRCVGGWLALAVAEELEVRGRRVLGVHLFDPPQTGDQTSVDDLARDWLDNLAAQLPAKDREPVTSVGEVFDRLRASGVHLTIGSRDAYIRRIDAVVATQHAAGTYAGGALAAPIVAHLPSDRAAWEQRDPAVYGSLDIAESPLGVETARLLVAPEVAPRIAAAAHDLEQRSCKL